MSKFYTEWVGIKYPEKGEKIQEKHDSQLEYHFLTNVLGIDLSFNYGIGKMMR